ncbi:GtrA family protein [Candidatus Igneacidithiobacillus taiwanensis]|uniref:GtrA family protein n=1 Tax=Candidatus Igneacidithiobacillus taiwanensis TaxID=1945924 RepID=UPI0028A269B4|nr:GtrA family protein [Candidatus Igneacidithiobacillus taiwanensis]
MASNKRFHEIIRFGVSGVAGFIVDAGLIAIFTQAFGLGPIVAQLIGFTAAVTVTWLINRHWTFAEHASDKWLHEWTRYVAANSIGAAVNNGVYVGLVLGLSAFSKIPVLAVAIGSIAGMGFNFLASKRLIFRALN